VVIEGSVEQIAACKAEMEKVLGWPIGDQALSLAIVQVPGPLKGRIIGSGGSTIKQLEREFMCNIGMPRDRADERVELEGPADKLDALMQAIEERIGQLLSVVQRVDPASDGTAGQLPKSLAPAIDFFRDSAGEVAEALFFEEGENGPEMTRMLNFLRSARKTIDVAVFSLTNDSIASVLLAQHSSGVVVRLVSDDEQSKGQGSDIERLSRAGIPVRLDCSPKHMHHKFAVLDRECLLSGSFNWTRAAALENEENIMIVNNASLVSQYAAHFEKMWERFGAA